MTWVPRHSDRLVGSHGWRERRLFETLGRWAQQSSFPPAKLALDRHSQHHAWRAMQWQERLPLLAGADRESLVVAPDPGTEASFEEMSRLEGDAARLAGAYRFALPRLATAYRAHLAEANPLSEGPTIRLLRIFLADVQADWLEGEVVLETFLAGAIGAQASGAGAIGAGAIGAGAIGAEGRSLVDTAARALGNLEALVLAGGGGGGRESNPPDGDRPSHPL